MKRLSHSSTEPLFPRLAVKREEAAQLLSISPSTFDDWVRKGWMPQGIKIGGIRLWDCHEIFLAWQDIRERNIINKEDDSENPFNKIVG